MYIYNLYLLSFILMLYRAPVDTSPMTEGVTLFKHQLLLLAFSFLFSRRKSVFDCSRSLNLMISERKGVSFAV